MNADHAALIDQRCAAALIQRRILAGNEIVAAGRAGEDGALERHARWHKTNYDLLEDVFGRETAELYEAVFVRTRGSRMKRLFTSLASDAEHYAQSGVTALVSVARTCQLGDVLAERRDAIFLVHGHADAVVHETARLLERTTSRSLVILREHANRGRLLLEKFEEHASASNFAVVIATDDDVGCVKGGVPVARARQNVVLELGFFLAHLGRSRVCVLASPGLEIPSDVEGLAHVSLGNDNWKMELLREVASSGIDVDFRRIPT